MAFFHLRSKTMHPCYLTHAALAEAQRTWVCPGCGRLKPGVQAVDVWLQGRAPRDKPLNFVFGSGVPLIHKELVDLLGDEIIQRDLFIGRVFDDRGDEVNDWVTFRGRRGVIVRGSKDARSSICAECRGRSYYGAGKRYLYPTPASDATIFESHLYGLVVPPEVYERVAVKKWRMLGVDKLPILAEPIDGLGVLPFK